MRMEPCVTPRVRGTALLLAITRPLLLAAWVCLGTAPLRAQEGDRPGELQLALPSHWRLPPSPALSPEQEQATFHLADGFAIELAAAEPAVQDPVALSFDEDGRMWVVEMRGFMPDVEGRGEDQPTGRISVLEDADGDGRFETARVYLEGLVLPRAMALVKDGVLVVHGGKLWWTRDTDGDLKADESVVVDPSYVETGNVEHQPNGLLRGLDNWLYSAKSKYRFRFRGGVWAKEETEFRGQWGITQDNAGRLYYNYNYSQLHGDVVPPNLMGRNPRHPSTAGINLVVATNQAVFPIRMDPGVNRGYRPGILDARGRLRQFASACAPCLYRGDLFPPTFQGDAFVCDPAAHLVKRNLLTGSGLNPASRFAYPESEFLASTDERFRPVHLANGPEGALYVVDMYRGIIQHKQYMTSHLKTEILSRNLQSPIHLGRVWRVRPLDHRARLASPKLNRLPAKDWIPFLAHPNGFWRDTAQRLLVERNDPDTVAGLETMALRHPDPLARLHALWTLEGLEAMNPDRLLPAMEDSDPRVVMASIRILAPRPGGRSPSPAVFKQKLLPLTHHTNQEVLVHAILGLGALAGPEPLPVLAGVLSSAGRHLIVRHAVYSGLQNRELALLELLLRDPRWAARSVELDLALTELAAVLMNPPDSAGQATLIAWAGARDMGQDWQRASLLAGILEGARERVSGPLELPARPALLNRWPNLERAEASNQIALLESVLAWPGHRPPVREATRAVALTDEQKLLFNTGRELYLAVCAACHGPAGEGLSPLAPPLARSSWVLGSEQRLARIVLHGLEGPIHVHGIRYEPPLILPNMPSLDSMTDDQLASVLTYIRRSWDHQAGPVKPAVITAIRRATASRAVPWTEEELLEVEQAGN